MKRLGVFLLRPVCIGCWSLAGLPPALNLLVPIYTHGGDATALRARVECFLPTNATKCSRPWLEPGPLDPETNELIMSPPKSTVVSLLTYNRRQTIYQIEWVSLRRVEESKILSLDYFTNLNSKKAQNRLTISCTQNFCAYSTEKV